MNLVKLILFVLLSVLAIPTLVLFIQVIVAAFLKKEPKTIQTPHDNNTSTVAVLIPAHNEALGISKTILSILPQLKKSDQLIVIADNCTDDTAPIAQKLGGNAIIRTNDAQRGKGFALDFGLQALRTNPPKIVIIIDADCTISDNLIAQLTRACQFYQTPIQALYLMVSPSNASLKTKIAEFAWLVKNKVRPLGFKALGLPCHLMGTGMAFLWEDIANTSLANGHIAEDMMLGVNLCRANKPTMFLPDACVSSEFPNSQAAETTQRTRWEHGHLSIILSEAPGLFKDAIKTRNLQMLGLGLDLIVPPLAILLILSVLMFTFTLIIHQFLPLKWLLFYATLILTVLTTSILIAWVFFGRHIISLKQLCYAPIYALNKIPLYIKFVFNRQVEWVRSKRD